MTTNSNIETSTIKQQFSKKSASFCSQYLNFDLSWMEERTTIQYENLAESICYFCILSHFCHGISIHVKGIMNSDEGAIEEELFSLQ